MHLWAISGNFNFPSEDESKGEYQNESEENYVFF